MINAPVICPKLIDDFKPSNDVQKYVIAVVQLALSEYINRINQAMKYKPWQYSMYTERLSLVHICHIWFSYTALL